MVVKGFGSVHKNEQVGEKGFNESLYKYVAIIIGVFIIAAFVWSNIPLAKTVTNVKTTTEASTGVATSPQNAIANGQETTGEGWYAIGETIKFDLMKKYGIMVTITPLGEANGYAIVATESDFGVLFNQNKYLVINTKFRIKGDNEIYETGETPFGPYTGEAIGNWKKTIGKPVDPSNVVWQAEFAVKDIPAQTQKVVTVK